MRNIKVRRGECVVVTWIDQKDNVVTLPLIRFEGREWEQVGTYSRGGTLFALKYKWKPTGRILRAIERTVK